MLRYSGTSSTANFVWGQGDFVSGVANQNLSAITSATLSQPTGLAVDGGGGLYVADNGNNRVLYFAAGQASGAAVANRVYGQAGGFTTGTANLGGIGANTLNSPSALVLDTSNNLYVADTGQSFKQHSSCKRRRLVV